MFEKLFEGAPDGMLVIDAHGKILLANPSAGKMFGYTADELKGLGIERLIPVRFRTAHEAHRAEYGANPRPRPMGAGLELFGLRKDGSEFPTDIMLSPVEDEEGRRTLCVVRDISERLKVAEEKLYLEEELRLESNFEEIIGESAVLRRVLKQAGTVARTDATVLILGETGTGKELIARAIHNLSTRKDQTFVRVNCAAIPGGLLESELFGHEKGAFTGALMRKLGRLELAHHGTLFLDEVGDIPLELQPKLLRAIQEKEFERLGSSATIPVDVRLVAATNRDLEQMVKNREFRNDLYYRLRVFPISVPPLRERTEDIPLLAHYFVHKHARRMNRKIESIPPETLQALIAWPWPGNVRELENLIERTVILSRGSVLEIPLAELRVAMPGDGSFDSSLQAAERAHILRVLRETRGVIGGPHGAAARLGLKRTTLNFKMRKLGISRSDV